VDHVDDDPPHQDLERFFMQSRIGGFTQEASRNSKLVGKRSGVLVADVAAQVESNYDVRALVHASRLKAAQESVTLAARASLAQAPDYLV
jgi:hypothetical protein